MKHVIQIDDNTPTGKNLIELLRNISLKFNSVSFMTEEKREELEDLYFGKMIEEADTGETVAREEVIKYLKS